MKKKFQPFSDDNASLNIGEFTIENGTDKVALYGSLDVTHDKNGLKPAEALKAAVDAIVKALEHRIKPCLLKAGLRRLRSRLRTRSHRSIKQG
jgi:hypothetical protein